ncbi:MAG TPA: aldo/keto reductase [Gemmatimonadaceae bacterium]|nr:aldo/keto reductase [Gemmatimonadaceae bacterium]
MERRRFVELVGVLAAGTLLKKDEALDAITRPIPSSGERIPVIGMGTWLTFDVGRSESTRATLRDVLQTFFNRGGRVIDSSPMYGRAELVVGDLLPQIKPRPPLFSATKVWTPGRRLGVMQMEASQKLWRVPKFDLLQVHNLVDWEGHLQTLKEFKASGRVRYIGVTTSHGRRHDELERIMLREPLDFVQITYNLADRSVENRILPLARERRMAVIINRPLDGGELFDRVRGKALPAWAREFDCTTWSQFFLKFVFSHPAVTCAIPATSQPAHMVENMGAGVGRLPDTPMRARMASHFSTL